MGNFSLSEDMAVPQPGLQPLDMWLIGSTVSGQESE